MDLDEFVKKVLVDINKAVDTAEVNSSRRIYFNSHKERPTVEFDVAVTAEHATKGSGAAGVKVLSFVKGEGEYEKANKSSTVSRVKFGVDIYPLTKSEEQERDSDIGTSGDITSMFNPGMQF